MRVIPQNWHDGFGSIDIPLGRAIALADTGADEWLYLEDPDVPEVPISGRLPWGQSEHTTPEQELVAAVVRVEMGLRPNWNGKAGRS